MASKPKQCPFCGALDAPALLSCDEIQKDEDAEDEGNDPSYAVCCDFHNGGCGATGPYDIDKDFALEAWNRRAS